MTIYKNSYNITISVQIELAVILKNKYSISISIVV